MNAISFWIRVAGFLLVACGSFAIWAFAGRIFTTNWSLYMACAVVFLIFGGFSLLPGSGQTTRGINWHLLWIFPLGFGIYAIVWCITWFTFKNDFGLISGSAIGIFALTTVFKFGLGFKSGLFEATCVVFFCYTIGYYLGEQISFVFTGTPGKLGWGAGFGLGMGVGLSYLVSLSRR